MNKRIIIIIISVLLFAVICIMLIFGITRLKADNNYTVKYENDKISSLTAVMHNDTVYFSIDDIENLGAIINYEDSDGKIIIYLNNEAIYAQIDSSIIEISKKKVLLSDAFVLTEENEILVPVDFFEKALGVPIEVDDKKKIITVMESTEEEDTILDLPNGKSSADVRKAAHLISDNLRYDYTSKTIIIKKENADKLNIETTDKSMEARYIIKSNINGLSNGKFDVNDDYIKSIEVDQDEITVFPNKILDYQISEDKDCLYICVSVPRDVYKHIVVVDAGHGGIDPGTIYEDIVEKDINLDVSQRLVKLLEKDKDIKVYPTRVDDTYYTTNERAAFGNAVGDIFVSIHINSYNADESVNGPEVWYYHHRDDTVLGTKCKVLAEITQSHIVNDLKLRQRELQINNFDVLVLTDIPAILCEMGFMTNSQDAAMLKDEKFRQNFAQALYDSIKDSFNNQTIMGE